MESVCTEYNETWPENTVSWISVMGLSTPSMLLSGLQAGPALPFNFATFH